MRNLASLIAAPRHKTKAEFAYNRMIDSLIAAITFAAMSDFVPSTSTLFNSASRRIDD
jgi:hypothetical protein